MRFEDYIPMAVDGPTIFHAIPTDELTRLWDSLMNAIYKCPDAGVRSDICAMAWECAVELDYRDEI